VSIIIPAYNEEGTILGVIEEVRACIAAHQDVDWEIIVIDDHSTDRTADVVGAISGVTLLRHPQNRGYGAALKSGIRVAKSDHILTMDADGQHEASEISKFLVDGDLFDMTIGIRPKASSPSSRLLGKKVLSTLVHLFLWQNVPDINSGMRLIRRSVILRYFNVVSNRFSFSMSSTMALTSEGHFVRWIAIECRPRQGQQSQVTIASGLSSLLTIFRVIAIFHPLRVFLPLVGFLGLLLGASLGWDLYTSNVSKLTLLLTQLTLTFGILGLISEQLAHIRRELRATDQRSDPRGAE
jgi:hypothetical protein